MSFFEVISVNHLNEYYPSESWRETLMFFSQTTPSVRHAAVALSLIHRSYHDSCSSHSEHGALFHYNKAIQLFLAQESSGNIEAMVIALLVCYLFTSFDNLAGNYQRAMIHLQGGVKLSRSIPDAMLDKSNVSSVNMFLIEVVKQLRRLDMQAGAYLVGWNAENTQETPEQEALFPNNEFDSVEHAANCHLVLLARAMRLHWMAQEAFFTEGVPPIASKQLVIEQLETWSQLFEQMLSTTNHHGVIGSSRLETLLRLQNTVLWILVSSLGPGREIEYDKFLPEFQRCVKMVDEVAFGHQHQEGSPKPRFTQDVAIIPILYIIGAKCRDPIVRQEVLRILRQQRLREAVWDSAFAARAVERIAEIEQDKIGGGCIKTMEEIEVSQRVECVSWEQVINNQGARLELDTVLFNTIQLSDGTHPAVKCFIPDTAPGSTALALPQRHQILLMAALVSSSVLLTLPFSEEHQVVEQEQSTDVLGGVRPIDALGEEQRNVYQSLLIEVLLLRKGQRDV
ncbi:hypothetical protein HG531_001078 [Fusarium graminearum]|nr:hypothetical protein HG531_001078 [Fusarium graminearum]